MIGAISGGALASVSFVLPSTAAVLVLAAGAFVARGIVEQLPSDASAE